jgi:hypothetical protein
MKKKEFIFGGYKGHVYNEIKNMEIGDVIEADLNGKRKQDYQRACKRVAEKIDTDYKTCTDLNGVLLIKRTY